MKKQLQFIFKIIGVIYVVKFIDSILFYNVDYRFFLFQIDRISYVLISLICSFTFLYFGFKQNKKTN
jgi:hypothetical protein